MWALFDYGSAWAYPFDVRRAWQVATDWTNQVVANGGAAPAVATWAAMANFTDSLITNLYLSPKMSSVNAIAADSLIAAQTPLLRGVRSEALSNNHNFVSGDLTVNGLKGNASNKYLKVRISPVPSSEVRTQEDSRMYVYTTANEAASEIQMVNGANDLELAIYLNTILL